MLQGTPGLRAIFFYCIFKDLLPYFCMRGPHMGGGGFDRSGEHLGSRRGLGQSE